jgi:membrane associated rhomboid family serine protease
VPDLNHILLFIAWISPAVLLIRTWRGGADPIWRRPAITVLLITTAATIFARRQAGFVAAGAWVALLVLPAIGIRKALDWAQREKFTRARWALNAMRPLHPARSIREHQRIISAMESAHRDGRALPTLAPRPMLFGRARVRMSRAVAVLIALNAAMFVAEIALGGSTNFVTLHRLGALEPYPVLIAHQYWRVLTAAFLHFGPLHLVVNLFALYVFGPTLERSIGSLRFTLSYLLCGIASCVLVALLWRFGRAPADQLVGASGAVMGIVGTWAGVLIHERHRAQNRAALRSILLILVVQSVFDVLTPQVSMAAHLGGFTTGLIAGLLIAPKRARP